jgi:hypothetical protein
VKKIADSQKKPTQDRNQKLSDQLDPENSHALRHPPDQRLFQTPSK